MTVYNKNRDGKWEIVKNDAAGNYAVTYYERYDACGWKQIGAAESYSKECAEYEFDINLDETEKEETEMKKFEVGAMYWDTSAVDHNDVMIIKITRRTEKSVWFVRMHGGKEDGEPSRTKIFANNSYEYITPYRYSMAPVWEADRKVEPEQTATEADEETADAPQKSATVVGKIEAAVSKYGVGMSCETLANKVCLELAADGIEAVILNDRYIMAGGAEYQFIKHSGAWAVKEFAETDAATDAPANDEAAEQAGQPATNGQEEKKMTLKQLFIETHMEFAKEEIDGVMVYTGGGEYCEPFGDVAEVLNRYGDREIEPIYLGGDYPASMTEPDARGMIHVALVEPQQAAQDSAEAEAARWKGTVRKIGERLNAFADAGDGEYKSLMFGEISRIIKKAERSGVALEAEYDADGRFTDVRERTEAADDDAEAGRPAPQADAASEGAESVEAEAAPAVRTVRNPVAPYDLFQFHAESGTYLFQNEGEAALIDALEFHADAENALSVVRALYEITRDGGGWFSPRNHPVMLDALNAYIGFMEDEIEIDNFPNAAEKEIAVGKLAEAKVIRDAFAADVARAAA